jgi:nucleoside-diphosphate-sugar epimerase
MNTGSIPGLSDLKSTSKRKELCVVTGAAGYVGLWLCKKLLEAGYDVIGVDRGIFPSGVSAFAEFCPGAELKLMDMRSITAEMLEGVSAVCHLGGLSNDPTADFDPQLNEDLNHRATEHIVAQCNLAGVNRITFAGSASVYGFNTGKRIDETAPTNPQSGYSSTKLAAEKHIRGSGGVVLRQATVGGWSPRMRWDLVVNTMFRSAMRDGVINVHAGGEASRPLVDVRDVADAHIVALNNYSAMAGDVFNVCHDRSNSEQGTSGYTVACLALWVKHCIEKLGFSGKIDVRGDWDKVEGRSYDVSGEKFTRVTGWKPKYGVDLMVASLWLNRATYVFDDPECKNIDWLKRYKVLEEAFCSSSPLWA